MVKILGIKKGGNLRYLLLLFSVLFFVRMSFAWAYLSDSEKVFQNSETYLPDVENSG